MILKINGDIVGNEWKDIYDWFGIECSTPKDVEKALSELPKGDRLQVKINSGGGEVMAGQEMYTMLRARSDVDIEVESLAASAASVIAMAGHCTISPVGMLMIHCVSAGQVSGNHRDMEKMAETLQTYDEALANAYVAKTGRSLDEILQLMNEETWLTASRAVELGFVDAISEDTPALTNTAGMMAVTPEMVKEYQASKAREKALEEEKENLLKDLDLYGGVKGENE